MQNAKVQEIYERRSYYHKFHLLKIEFFYGKKNHAGGGDFLGINL